MENTYILTPRRAKHCDVECVRPTFFIIIPSPRKANVLLTHEVLILRLLGFEASFELRLLPSSFSYFGLFKGSQNDRNNKSLVDVSGHKEVPHFHKAFVTSVVALQSGDQEAP